MDWCVRKDTFSPLGMVRLTHRDGVVGVGQTEEDALLDLSGKLRASRTAELFRRIELLPPTVTPTPDWEEQIESLEPFTVTGEFVPDGDAAEVDVSVPLCKQCSRALQQAALKRVTGDA